MRTTDNLEFIKLESENSSRMLLRNQKQKYDFDSKSKASCLKELIKNMVCSVIVSNTDRKQFH